MTTVLWSIEFWDNILNRSVKVSDYALTKSEAWEKYKNPFRVLILVEPK